MHSQPNYYSFQTIGTNEFPPELELAGNFPSTALPARLVQQPDPSINIDVHINEYDYSDSDYDYDPHMDYDYDYNAVNINSNDPPGFQEPLQALSVFQPIGSPSPGMSKILFTYCFVLTYLAYYLYTLVVFKAALLEFRV